MPKNIKIWRQLLT